MGKVLSVLVLVGAIGLAGVAAQGEDGKGKAKRGPGKGEAFKAEILKKFDANGDGKLDDAERAKAREAFMARFKGKGGPGPEFMQKLLERFDKNGNKQLDPEEKAAMKEEFAKRRAEFKGKGKPGEGRGKPGEGKGKPGFKGKRDGDKK